jgi:hypothetical protein
MTGFETGFGSASRADYELPEWCRRMYLTVSLDKLLEARLTLNIFFIRIDPFRLLLLLLTLCRFILHLHDLRLDRDSPRYDDLVIIVVLSFCFLL